MNEVRRARIQCEIEQLASARERIAKIRDDEDRAIRGERLFGNGDQEATDLLSEVGFVLLIALDKLNRVKKCRH